MKKILLFVFLMSCFAIKTYSQCSGTILTVNNPSFEGTPQAGAAPPDWGVCQPGTTPDIQPGIWGVTLAPANGNSYVGMVDRANTGWHEGVSQVLSGPMVAGTIYNFTIDLATTNSTQGGITPGCIELQIYGNMGGNNGCDETTLLWSSGNVTSLTWQTYNITFTPTQNWTNILFMEHNLGCTTNPYIMMDNLSAIAPVNFVPQFTWSNPCQGGAMQFTDQSTTSQGAINSWSWNFGDGNTSTLQNPSHVYSASGTYNVTLTVTNTVPCTATVTHTVTIYPSPSFTIAPANPQICTGGSVTLTATGTNTYQWSPATGLSATSGATVIANPTTTTTYTVTSTSTNCGTAINAVTVQVNNLSPAGITIHVAPSDSICPQTSVTFTTTTTNAGLSPSYQWMLNGNVTGTNSPVYYNDSLVNHDKIWCILTSSSSCASPDVVTSDTIEMYVICNFDSIIVPPDYYSEQPNQSFKYYPNMGQIEDILFHSRPDIKYYSYCQTPALYFCDTSLSYVFAKIDTGKSTPDTLFRVDMTFINSQFTMICPKEMNSDYTNYFLAQCPHGITNVPNYRRLIYPGVWPHIDLEYCSNGSGLKYYFVVKPCSKGEEIKLKYSGATAINIDTAGGLNIITTIGTIHQEKPHAYLLDSTYSHITDTIPIHYALNNDTLRFVFPNYPRNKVMVIQVDKGQNSTATTTYPPPCWSTFFGGNSGDQGEAATTDNLGCIYICGGTESNLLFPIWNGLYPHYPSGSSEQAFFSKLDNNHIGIFSTYFGGSDYQEAHDIKINSIGDIYICGYTTSIDLPCQNETGAYNYSTLQGSQDAFIAKFNSNGSNLIWSTYFGGNGYNYYDDDNANSLDFDSNGNFYVVGAGTQTSSTLSGETFPLLYPTASYYSTNFATNTTTAAFIAKFGANDAEAWCTFYGGSNLDWASAVKVDKQDNPFILGSTYSSDFPTPTASTVPFVKATFGGLIDDFIIKFNSSGTRQWASYIGGAGAEDVTPIDGAVGGGNRIAFDSQNNVYIVGATESSDFPIPSSHYDDTYKTHSGYILEFDGSSLGQLWGTFISGDGQVDLNSIVIDAKDRLFTGGCTSDNAFPLKSVSGLYYQGSIVGSSSTYANDACIVGFDNNHNLIYGTYFGGNASFSYGQFIWGMALYNDDLYFTGYTSTEIGSGPGAFPLYDPNPGVDWFTNVYGGGFQDAFISEFCISASLNINNFTENNANLLLYPNPVSNEFTLSFENRDFENVTINICNSLGQLVKTIKYYCNSGNNNIILNVSSLNNGIYFVNIKGKNLNENAKFIKIN